MAPHPTIGACTERHVVTTVDRWRLPLRRHHVCPTRPQRRPVVLCHGMGSNHLHLDWDETHGIAQHLARRGHDVFVIGLRGSRGSDPPSEQARWSFGFDELLDRDLRAHIDRVLRITGSERVLFVGHSMGGMLGLAAGAIPALAERLHGRIGLATCASFAHHAGLARWLPAARWLAAGFGNGVRVPRRASAQLEARVLGWIPLPSRLVPVGLDAALLTRLHASLTEDLPLALIEQTVGWIIEDAFVSRDRSIDFRAALALQAIPTLLLSGAADPWAPPRAVQRTAQWLGSSTTVEILGRARGATIDYGHTNLLFGPAAPREVFELVGRWLDTHQ